MLSTFFLVVYVGSVSLIPATLYSSTLKHALKTFTFVVHPSLLSCFTHFNLLGASYVL